MQNQSSTNLKMRKNERRPFTHSIDYSLISDPQEPKRLDLKGTGVDISEAGIGIQTDHPLEPGQVIWVDSGAEAQAGLVRWSTRVENGYRAGLELDGKPVKHLEAATDLFNKKLEEIEKRCLASEEEPEKILESVAEAIDTVCEACKLFEAEVKDGKIIRDAQIRFREKTNPLLSKSYFINRARTWPQGYQGDYKMLESTYRNTPLSKGIGYYLDLISLNNTVAVAVKNRMTKLQDILREELTRRKNPSVLNIACGSCREVFELAVEIEKSGAKITCIDLDNDALAFAANRLSFTNISPIVSDQVELRKYNAVRMFDDELNMNEFGMQDIIYSVGFFDYLKSDFLATLFKALYRLLAPGGVLITSFKDADRYRSQDFHWTVDWNGFLQRTEKDFEEIFRQAHIPRAAITEMREDSGVIVFYLITKQIS